MTMPRPMRSRLIVFALSVIVAQCGKKPQPVAAPPPPPPPTDLVALTLDPDTHELGRAVVEAQGASVTLETDLAATRIAEGRPPAAPITLSQDEFQQAFGPVLGARAPAPIQFLLYFETGGNTLTQESQVQFDTTVGVILNRPVPDVSVVGHTDTVGDAAANAALGLRRANLIRNQLLSAGVPASQIEASTHGEANPLVRTSDNVAEPRNRRVEITVR